MVIVQTLPLSFRSTRFNFFTILFLAFIIVALSYIKGHSETFILVSFLVVKKVFA